MTPTDIITTQEETALPAKRAAAISWMHDRWLLHDRHFVSRARIKAHSSAVEMLRPLWQRKRGVEESPGTLDGLRQRMRFDAHYGRQNERDREQFFTTDRSAVK